MGTTTWSSLGIQLPELVERMSQLIGIFERVDWGAKCHEISVL